MSIIEYSKPIKKSSAFCTVIRFFVGSTAAVTAFSSYTILPSNVYGCHRRAFSSQKTTNIPEVMDHAALSQPKRQNTQLKHTKGCALRKSGRHALFFFPTCPHSILSGRLPAPLQGAFTGELRSSSRFSPGSCGLAGSLVILHKNQGDYLESNLIEKD